MTTTAQRETMESLATEVPVFVDLTMNISTERKGGTSGRFVLYSTTAPESYDYNVIPVLENDGIRWLLVHEPSLRFQLDRWASGLYGYYLSNDPTTDGILATLWSRLHTA